MDLIHSSYHGSHWGFFPSISKCSMTLTAPTHPLKPLFGDISVLFHSLLSTSPPDFHAVWCSSQSPFFHKGCIGFSLQFQDTSNNKLSHYNYTSTTVYCFSSTFSLNHTFLCSLSTSFFSWLLTKPNGNVLYCKNKTNYKLCKSKRLNTCFDGWKKLLLTLWQARLSF